MTNKHLVPFVANSDDDMHCVPAVFRMLNQHFFDEDLSWKEIDEVLKVIPNKGVWTFLGQLYLAKKGLDIINIEPIDFEKLIVEGMDYLYEVVGEKTADYYINNSNLFSVLDDLPEYLEHIRHETRRSSVNEIKKYLRESKLVTAEVDSGVLNGHDNFCLHMVLIIGFENNHFIIHDPGLPPLPARKVTEKELERAFAYDGANQGISVFSKKVNNG